MKRFHVHLHVEDIRSNVSFYSALFGASPAREESDYAKWMLADPPINFAISTRGAKPGIDHVGIQTETSEDLIELKARAQVAALQVDDSGTTTCCYAKSEKYWLVDPQGLAWEHFHTLESTPTFGVPARSVALPAPPTAAASCAPTTGATARCC